MDARAKRAGRQLPIRRTRQVGCYQKNQQQPDQTRA
jgi:hypothetical protein